MSLAIDFLKRCWFPLALVGLVALGAWLIQQQAWEGGRNEANAEWQGKWDKHALADAQATAQAQTERRAIEAMRAQTITKVTQDAQHAIDQARTDAADAAAHADSLRDTIDQAVSRLADSQASVSACTADASKAAARYARLFADLFKRADQAAGSMAAAADQARVRGLACEAAYDGLGGGQ